MAQPSVLTVVYRITPRRLRPPIRPRPPTPRRTEHHQKEIPMSDKDKPGSLRSAESGEARTRPDAEASRRKE